LEELATAWRPLESQQSVFVLMQSLILLEKTVVPRDRESYLNEFIGLPERWTNFRVIVLFSFSRP
jgi:hypothetical protein